MVIVWSAGFCSVAAAAYVEKMSNNVARVIFFHGYFLFRSRVELAFSDHF